MASLHDTPTASRSRSARSQAEATIGPWRLVRLLGRGQWTEVYQAQPASSPPDAAADYTLKLLRASSASDPQAVCMLQREAFIARQLLHPHLASVLSSHVDQPPRYLLLPYLEGATARAALAAAGRIAPPQALWITRQTAAGLEAMHEQGWLHSDVKPDNLLISPSGHTTLLDLGLARSLASEAACHEVLSGSLAYAPPEVFHGQLNLMPQSDIYSLGVTLYELLTGQLPFSSGDPVQLAAAHLTQPAPDTRRLLPQLPSAVSRLVRRMLAKEPLRRPSASELIDSLADLEVELLGWREPDSRREPGASVSPPGRDCRSSAEV